MDWHRLWIPSAEDFRLTQLLAMLLMAAVIGAGVIRPLRPWRQRIGRVGLWLFFAAILALVLWRLTGH